MIISNDKLTNRALITVGFMSWPNSLTEKLEATSSIRPVPTQGSQTVSVRLSFSVSQKSISVIRIATSRGVG